MMPRRRRRSVHRARQHRAGAQTAQALAESQAETRRHRRCAAAPCRYFGQDGIYRFANRSYVEWFGRTPEEVIGRHLREVIAPAFTRTARR